MAGRRRNGGELPENRGRISGEIGENYRGQIVVSGRDDPHIGHVDGVMRPTQSRGDLAPNHVWGSSAMNGMLDHCIWRLDTSDGDLVGGKQSVVLED